jgi:hypothetical protein
MYRIAGLRDLRRFGNGSERIALCSVTRIIKRFDVYINVHGSTSFY